MNQPMKRTVKPGARVRVRRHQFEVGGVRSYMPGFEAEVVAVRDDQVVDVWDLDHGRRRSVHAEYLTVHRKKGAR